MSANLFEDIKTLLEFYQAMGLEGIPVTLKEPAKARSEACGSHDAAKTGITRKAMISPPSPSPAGGESSDISATVGGRDIPKFSPPLMGRDKGEGDSAADKERLLNELRQEMGDCVRCKLSSKRKNIVFGEGNPDARLMFIGEGPGAEEDIQGRPFVGEAGALLTRLIVKMGFKREDVYIGNIVKCRPPMNRDPEEDEVASCRPFIERQIDIIRPEVIVVLGRIALQTLFNNPTLKITAVRGKFLEYKGIPVMPTFHPAYLLRNRSDMWKTWDDAVKVMERLNQE